MSEPDNFRILLQAIAQSKLPGQADERALLRWFLFNVFRLDEIASSDSVCDAGNDKGIDGVWVDPDAEEIIIFQATHSDRIQNTLGDVKLREFVSSAKWLESVDNLNNLLASNANRDLKALVRRLELVELIKENYRVKQVFVTTRRLDTNGKEFLNTVPTLEVWDRERLVGYYSNIRRKTRVNGKHRFKTEVKATEYKTGKGHLYAAAVSASDVASMSGIADRTLFSLNVRLGLGRTRVNRDIEKAIKEEVNSHDNFLLFHNGLTVICRKLSVSKQRIEIEDYSVVNGCQSVIAFYENKSFLTDRLRILARFIEVGDDDAFAGVITYRTNNQNGIDMRDLRSNDRIQLALKKEIKSLFGGEIIYVIKAGEETTAKDVLPNDRAGQLILSLYLDEPYNAHQKYKLFDMDYERVFARGINAGKICLSHFLYKVIDVAAEKIEDPLIKDYRLTKFILLGLLGGIFRHDKFGAKLLDQPGAYLPKNHKAIIKAAERAAAQMIPDFNFFIKERKESAEFYDYKSEFKSPDKYRIMRNEIQRDYQKALAKCPDDSFEKIFRSMLSGVEGITEPLAKVA